MYQFQPDRMGQPAQCIKRLADNAFIPFDPDNTDASEFAKWLSKGNTPEPADIPTPPSYRELRAAAYPPATDYLDAIVKGSQVQAQAYIDACLAVKAKYPKP